MANLQLHVYAEKLAEWDQDVVMLVLHYWPLRSKWFPTWFELERDMEVMQRVLSQGLEPNDLQKVVRQALPPVSTDAL